MLFFHLGISNKGEISLPAAVASYDCCKSNYHNRASWENQYYELKAADYDKKKLLFDFQRNGSVRALQ
jgi:hypothetical protein